MVLRRANKLLGALEWVGPGYPRNGSCPPQNHYVPRHINNSTSIDIKRFETQNRY
jgi:hypothetical protein